MTRRPTAREYDFIVYGASGFTGRKVCLYLAERMNVRGGGRWAIAGRDQDKLTAVKEDLRKAVLGTDPGLIIAPIMKDGKEDGLNRMCARARMILNAVGPYRKLGEPVVKSCIDNGTDYTDICGEPEFMDKMLFEHHERAAEKGVFIVCACAFDSVPADLGVLFTAKQFKGEEICSSIESFLMVDYDEHEGMAGHLTTYEAAVDGYGAQEELRQLRKQLRDKYPLSTLPSVGPKLLRKDGPYYDQRCGRYVLPFPGSDAAVVRNSQRILLQDADDRRLAPQYAAYIGFKSSLWHKIACCCGCCFSYCTACWCGRGCLLSCPCCFTCGTFTAEGPTDAQLDGCNFVMKFFARGYRKSVSYGATESKQLLQYPEIPDLEVVTSVSGPEPGYIATPKIFVTLSECLFDEWESMPSKGGVFTPAGLFAHTRLIEKLDKVGIKFSVESRQDKC